VPHSGARPEAPLLQRRPRYSHATSPPGPARRASFRTGSSAGEPVSQDPLWYKDTVFHELHVKAFHDANGDGIGGFNG
jgi:hypothetical protein